ncbi:ABC transporter permease [Marinobacter sp. M3C]|uniref:FtsX-like permease family protein n=1 Tax=Marinobacter sp. M3C TaxID=2917715 RepID=UPI00200C1B1F|nr:ABC transporter permease [Marinobacter sp. M3C]UQG58328.1 ABC transporter permease [Marinobacter sp. M3C]
MFLFPASQFSNLFSALFSHYRRHPLQLLALALMIMLATMLWTGVNHLTTQARASLGQSEQAVAARSQVERVDGQALTVADFVTLRRAGLCVMPWLEVERPGQAGRLVGVDPLAAGCFARATPSTDDNRLEPPKKPEPAWVPTLNGEPFIDISEAAALAQNVASRNVRFSLLIVPPEPTSALPADYRMTGFSLGPDTGELGESFLLNLDALGFLVLLITALLLRSVYQLGMAQRRDSFALLQRFGVTPSAINRVLLVEILLLALLSVVPGVWLGRLLAGTVGGGFGQALDSLFDTPLYAGQAENWLTPIVTMMAIVLAVCLAQNVRALLLRMAAAWPFALPAKLLTGFGFGVSPWPWLAMPLAVAGLAMALLAQSLPLVFVAVALVFTATGIAAPFAIAALSATLARKTREPLARWRHTELGVMARRLALPLVALQFALAMVLAVQALVTVFEATFDEWLGQRLAADYFIEVPAGASANAAAQWLAAQPELAQSGDWHQVVRGVAQLPATDSQVQSVDLFALGPVSPLLTMWSLQAAGDQPWQGFAAGEGVMVNEQLARRYPLAVGDTLVLTLADTRLELPVLAIYADYGRPAGEVLINLELLPNEFVPAFESFSISPGVIDIALITDGLQRLWQVDSVRVRDNKRVRELADAVFDQTFLLTRAMTFVTLVLAAVALLIMGWVFFSTRAWYFRLLQVWGLTRRQVLMQLGRLALTLTLSITLLALPLGVWLTWVLVHRINPLAFGWSLPMAIYPGFWLQLGVVSMLVGLSITLLMRSQLGGSGPKPVSAASLQGDER